MNSDLLIGFGLGAVVAVCLCAVWDDTVDFRNQAFFCLIALACMVTAFVLMFWDYLRWVI